jgi:hypothetical protein
MTTTIKKPNSAKFLASLMYAIRSRTGTAVDMKPLKEYQKTLQFITDLGFPFSRVLELEKWKPKSIMNLNVFSYSFRSSSSTVPVLLRIAHINDVEMSAGLGFSMVVVIIFPFGPITTTLVEE